MTRSGQWRVHDERRVFAGPGIDLMVADVTSPDGSKIEYDVVRARFDTAAALTVDGSGQVLLAWRHRFIPDSWGWELPANGMRRDETPEEAAGRAVWEECGWSTTGGRLLWSVPRCPERTDQVGHLVFMQAQARVARRSPATIAESAWFALPELARLMAERQVQDLLTLAALLWWLGRPGR